LPGEPADADTQGLGAGLLGGEAFGVARGGVGLPVGAGPFDLCEDPLLEPLAEPLERSGDAADVGQVRAAAEDHGRARSISWRIRRMASSRPTKIGSPIRKWPILSSATCGMAAIGATVS